jgi:hypothetical protein
MKVTPWIEDTVSSSRIISWRMSKMPRQWPAGLTISDHGYRTARMNAASVFDRFAGRYMAGAF